MFLDHLRSWFRGPLEIKIVAREVGISEMDNERFRREVLLDTALDLVFKREIAKWNRYNWYLSNAYAPTSDYNLEGVLYDRFTFDFDYEADPSQATTEATSFANRIEEHLGCRVLVAESGFKGANVYVFLSEPQSWSIVEKLWKYLVFYAPQRARKMIDMNMNQWNRVCRIPLTYNLKKGEKRISRIIYPEIVDDYSSFTWSLVKPLDIARVEIVKPQLPPIPEVKRIKPKPREMERKWVQEVARTGLPDGRKRFLLEVLIPYLAVVREMGEEDVLATCIEFIENSCKNFNKCDKIYESWIKSAIRSARARGFRGFSLAKLREKDPDLYNIISQQLESMEIVVSNTANSGHDYSKYDYTEIVAKFVKETGKTEFTYEDFKSWLEAKSGKITAGEWHKWERILRLLAEKDYLGRKYQVGEEWVDYGPGKIDKPPSKTVKFYIHSRHNFTTE